MATKKGKGFLVLEILGALLLVLLYIILTEPPKIWKIEAKKENDCRLHMRSIYEAESYYFQRNDSFNLNVDELVAFLENDSILQNNRKIVQYSRMIHENIQKFFDIPIINAIYRINSAFNTIKGDYIQNETYLERPDEQIQQIDRDFQIVIKKIDGLYDPLQYKNIASILLYMNKIDSIQKNINDFKIQMAAQLATINADSISKNIDDLEIGILSSKLNEIQDSLYFVIAELKDSPLARITNLPDRMKKFTDQIKRANGELPLFNKTEQINLLSDQVSKFRAMHDDFVTPEKFTLSNSYASLALTEEDSLLIKLKPSFAYCPDSGEPYIYTIYGSARNLLHVECPNLQQWAADLITPELAKIKDFQIWDSWKIISDANDSLYQVLNEAVSLYRKTKASRDIILNKKEVETQLNLFYQSTPLSYKYSKQIDVMIDTLTNAFRLSLLKTELEENLNGLDTLALRCETNDFKAIDGWMEKIYTKSQIFDSVLTANKKFLKRSDRSKLKSIMPVVDYWKSQIEEYKTTFKPQFAPVLKEVRVNLNSTFEDKIQKGKRETTKVIFKEKHENHGFVDNGQLSWE